jgi:hypothetical protein
VAAGTRVQLFSINATRNCEAVSHFCGIIRIRISVRFTGLRGSKPGDETTAGMAVNTPEADMKNCCPSVPGPVTKVVLSHPLTIFRRALVLFAWL